MRGELMALFRCLNEKNYIGIYPKTSTERVFCELRDRWNSGRFNVRAEMLVTNVFSDALVEIYGGVHLENEGQVTVVYVHVCRIKVPGTMTLVSGDRLLVEIDLSLQKLPPRDGKTERLVPSVYSAKILDKILASPEDAIG